MRWVLVAKEGNQIKFTDLYLGSILFPTFTKLAKYLDAEINMRDLTKKHLDQIRSKSFFVSNSERAMHFISNKLGPISALVESMELFYEEGGSKVFGNKLVDDQLRKNVKQGSNALQAIRNRTKGVLNKKNNPFNVVSLSEHPVYGFMRFLIRFVDDVFAEKLKIDFDLGDLSSLEDKKVHYNEQGLYFVLTDWTSNMLKHGLDYSLEIKEVEGYYFLVFSNSFDSEAVNQVRKMVSDFNSADRIEIIRRKSHGVYQLKMTLEEMKIPCKMELDDNVIKFQMSIKKT